MAVKVKPGPRLDRRWKHHDDSLGNAAKRAEVNTAGPWTAWKGTRVGRFVRFAEKYLRSPKSENMSLPLKLMPWQKEYAEAFLEGDYSEAVLGMGRGGGKSTFIAALAMFGLFDSDEQGAPSIPIVATSLGQAKDAVYSQIEYMREVEPEIRRRTLAYSGIGTERLVFPRNHGAIFPKPQEPKALQGLNLWPFGFVDEIGHVSPQTWSAVKMGRKRKGARVLGAGTWGPDTTSALYHLRGLVRDGHAPTTLLWQMFTGDPGADLMDEANWHRANPSLRYGLPNLELVRNEIASDPEALVRTFRLNEPDVVGHDSWLGRDARTIWNGLTDDYSLGITLPTYVGVDIGLVRDCTAVVCVQLRPDGRLHAAAKIWTPRPGLEVDLAAISQYVIDLTFKYQVIEVSYDPRFFELEALRLEASRVPMVKVPQSTETMTPIISDLRSRIMAGQLTHDADELFTAHVVNAVPQINERGYTLSKSKSAPRGHIDACIALALAVDRFAHKRASYGVWVG